MEIKYNLAGKTLRGDVAAIVAASGCTIEEAIRQWSEAKFTAWAQRNLLETPVVGTADAESVTLTVDAQTGAKFLREVGGREIG